MSIKVPLTILKIKKKTLSRIYWFGSLSITIIYIILSILKGVSLISEKNLSRNYFSHVNLKSINNNEEAPKELSSWYYAGEISPLEAQKQPFVRGLSTRSTVSAYCNNVGVQIVALGGNITSVLNNFMMIGEDQKEIALNQAHIGYGLAKILNLKIGDSLFVTIPSTGKFLNLTVGHIFASPDYFIDHYDIYISQSTLDPIVNNTSESYHFRFKASPFIALTISNINTYTMGRKYMQPPDYLKYQSHVIKLLEHNIIKWSLYTYIILGLIIVLSIYLTHHKIIDKFNFLTYRFGTIQKISMIRPILTLCLRHIIRINIRVLILLFIFFLFCPPIPTSIFTSIDGLFAEYSLRTPYIFVPLFAFQKILFSMIIGTILFLFTVGIMLILYCTIPFLLKSQHHNSYAFIAIGLLGITGFISSQNYFYNTCAQAGQISYCKQYYFGDKSLYEKNYLRNKFLGLPPIVFPLNQNLMLSLEQKKTSYIATLETLGTLKLLVNDADSTSENHLQQLIKSIKIQSIVGQYYPNFTEIIAKTAQNKNIVGKNIEKYFGKDTILTLNLQTPNGQNKKTSIAITESVDLGTEELNNTLFINHYRLSEQLGISPQNFTKLQIQGSHPNFSDYTNNKIIQQTLKQNMASWSVLSNMVLSSMFISLLFNLFMITIFLINIYAYISIYNKKNLLLHHIWGLPYHPLNKYISISFYSLTLGITFCWILCIRFIFIKLPTPLFLYLTPYIPKNLYFYPQFSSIAIVLLMLPIAKILSFYWINRIIKTHQKDLVESSYSNYTDL